MPVMDCNCFLGHWPFRKIRKDSFDDLQAVHRKNGINGGYVSSLDSVFYNDPFEGDLELHETVKDSAYKQILSVNPALPCWRDDIRRGRELLDIRGVRIYPGYHPYDIGDKAVDNLCSVLAQAGIPLVLTVRLEDVRMNWLMQEKVPSTDAISRFLSHHPDNTILLTGLFMDEIRKVQKDILDAERVYVDVSGLKDYLFPVEKLLEMLPDDRVVYGSQHPLYCLKSTFMAVETAKIAPSARENILGNNARRIFEP